MSNLKPVLAIVLSLVAGIIYAIIARLAFGIKELSEVFGTLSVAFLFVMPLAIGVLTALLAPEAISQRRGWSWVYAAFAPWIPCGIFVVIAAVASLEVWICVIMASPILFVMSTVGGIVARIIIEIFKPSDRARLSVIVLFAIAPYLFAPIENLFPLTAAVRHVESQIEVNASPEAVWDNIARFPKVNSSEQRQPFFYLIGLPRPVEATLSNAGAGGGRRGNWEYGLAFDGLITEWKPNQTFTVQLKVDTSGVRDTAMPLRGIGGKYFDMVDDSYIIEPAGNGKVIVRLSSTYRLSTRFNFYGTAWVDLFLHDIQNHILQIVKQRAETK